MKIAYALTLRSIPASSAEFLRGFRFSEADEIIFLCLEESEAGIPDSGRAAVAPPPATARRESFPSDIFRPGRLPVPKLTTLMIHGNNPGHRIVVRSEVQQADMIVLDLSGKSAGTLFTHPVIRSVVIASSMPVLVLKSALCRSRRRMKILYATDGSVSALSTGNALTRLPFRAAPDISIMNVITADETVPGSGESSPAHQRAASPHFSSYPEVSESEKILSEARACMGSLSRSIAGISRYGDPTVSVLREAETIGADLVAVGFSGFNALKGLPGTMPMSLIRHSPCGILIGKAC